MSIVRFSSRVLLALLLLVVAARAQVAAVVTDQTGSARFQREGEWKTVGLLTTLPAGAVLDLSEDARTTLSFVKGGRVVRLQGPCRATVTLDGVDTEARVQVEEAARLVGSAVPRSVNFDRMGGLVRVDEQTAPAVTSNSVVLQSSPLLTWTFELESEGFRVVVLETETEEEVFAAEARPGERTLTLTGLQPGVEYTVLLSTHTKTDAYETAHPLKILDPQKVAVVRRYEEAAKSGKFSAQVCLLSLYLDMQLWSNARPLVEELLTQRPEDPNLLRLQDLLKVR